VGWLKKTCDFDLVLIWKYKDINFIKSSWFDNLPRDIVNLVELENLINIKN